MHEYASAALRGNECRMRPGMRLQYTLCADKPTGLSSFQKPNILYPLDTPLVQILQVKYVPVVTGEF